MLARLNWAAKAVIAFAVPSAVLLTDIAVEWLGITEDQVIDVNEGHAFVLFLVTAVGVFFKKNGPAPDA